MLAMKVMMEVYCSFKVMHASDETQMRARIVAQRGLPKLERDFLNEKG
jgi:hypothetical protein